jgi:hypothetical protein
MSFHDALMLAQGLTVLIGFAAVMVMIVAAT